MTTFAEARQELGHLGKLSDNVELIGFQIGKDRSKMRILLDSKCIFNSFIDSFLRAFHELRQSIPFFVSSIQWKQNSFRWMRIHFTEILP
jgi:hypothetical protein